MPMSGGERVRLVAPDVAWEAAFRAMAADFAADTATVGERWHAPADAIADFASYVARQERMARGEGLPAGLVPQTTYWLAVGDALVGETRLRHQLIPALEDVGGHIGYSICPSARRKGYGTAALRLTLDRARELGLSRVLLTCDADNIASARIIERYGGVLASESVSPRTNRLVRRYWIAL
jgi:predicted acetyltransferase